MGIAFSKRYRGDQTIKPRGRRADYKTENATPPDIELEPDKTLIKGNVLTTLQITSKKRRVSDIFLTEPNTIEELFMEYTVDPANCLLMCACGGSKGEIAQYWKDAEALISRGVEMYIPFRGGEHIVATKVTSFQTMAGDLEIVDIPDFTDSSKEICRSKRRHDCTRPISQIHKRHKCIRRIRK